LKILDPIEEFWAEKGRPEQYTAGTSGPIGTDLLMQRDGRAWRRL
jgi:glucose-6-phosphate 1-dehydrogenase